MSFFRSRWGIVAIYLGILTAVVVVWQGLLAQERRQMLQSVATGAASIKSSIERNMRAHVVALRNYGQSNSERLEGETANIWLSEASLFLALFRPYQSVAWLNPSLEVRWVGSRKGADMSSERIAAFTRGHDEPLKAAGMVSETLVVPARNSDDERLQLGIYVPIFTDEAFRGYMFGLLDLRALLGTIISRHRFQDFSIAVYGDVEEVFSRLDSMADPPDEWRRTAVIGFHPNNWRLEVWPTRELIDRTQTVLPQVALIAGLLLSALVAVVHLFQIRIGRERREAERALAERERRLRGVFDNVADAVITFDESNTVDTFNAAAERIFGYSAEEAFGQDVRSLIPVPTQGGSDNGANGDHFEELERGTTVDAGQSTGRRKDGTEFPMDLSISEMGLGEIRLFIAVARDISNRKRIEAQLQQAQKMEAVGKLTGGVAHEFNNLLQGLYGYVNLLRDRVEKDEDTSNIVDQMDRIVWRGSEITKSLLAFARKQPLSPHPIDAAKVVVEVARILRGALTEEISFTTKISGDLWAADADPNQIESALVNLSINARDAMPNGGSIVVEASNARITEREADGFRFVDADRRIEPGDYVRFRVTDSGQGMTAEVLEHAFDPFFTTKDVGQGTGLGLSMVYGFASQSNGFVDIASEVGEGTRIDLYLPKARESEVTEGNDDAT